MRVKLVSLAERRLSHLSPPPAAKHPHEGMSFHVKGKDLPTQYHGGPVQVRNVDPGRLDRQGRGSKLGKGFYTTNSPAIAKDRANVVAALTKSHSHSLTVKKAHPDANILHAHTDEDRANPDLRNAIHKFSPKYAKTGDTGLGDMTWKKQVDKFAEHHGYDAVRYDLHALPYNLSDAGTGSHTPHITVWKNHGRDKLVHINGRVATKKGFKALGEDDSTTTTTNVTAPPKKKFKFTPATDPAKRARQKQHIMNSYAKKREKEAWSRGDEEEKAWLASQRHETMSEKKHSNEPPPDRITKHEISGTELGHFWHGNPRNGVREIDGTRLGKRDGGYFGKGFYGTKDKEWAKSYRKTGLYGQANTEKGSLVKKQLIHSARVIRYNRIVSKNQPEFVEKVLDHNVQHGHMDSGDAWLAQHNDNHSSTAHEWDHAVTRYAKHHKFDATHVIHGQRHDVDDPGGQGTDEVVVHRIHAIKGPEQQAKLPVFRHLYNFNKPEPKERHAVSASGKMYRLKKPV